MTTSKANFSLILSAVKEVHDGQTKVLERLAVLETSATEEDKRAALFWSKDWSNIVERVGAVEERLHELSKSIAKMNGIPADNNRRIQQLEQFKWRAIGAMGGAGLLGGSIGAVIMEIMIRRLVG